MRRTGIRRKVDDLGRVVIPSSMRKTLGILEGDELEFSVDGDRLILARPAEVCVFCEGQDHLDRFHDKIVCWSCAAALRALDRERSGSRSRRL